MFEAGDDLVLEAAGGGGTAFSDTFRWIEKNSPEASAIAYLTDLYVYDFGEEPRPPVIWVHYGPSSTFEEQAAKTPFGEVISLPAR